MRFFSERGMLCESMPSHFNRSQSSRCDLADHAFDIVRRCAIIRLKMKNSTNHNPQMLDNCLRFVGVNLSPLMNDDHMVDERDSIPLLERGRCSAAGETNFPLFIKSIISKLSSNFPHSVSVILVRVPRLAKWNTRNNNKLH